MAGDDCSLHFDLNDLTPKQRADHESNIYLTALLQVALLGIGKAGDRVSLFQTFEQSEWQPVLAFFQEAFADLGLNGVPPAGCSYHPEQGFYTSVAASIPDVERVALYMTSGSNAPLHQSDTALAVSRNVNSKFHFAEHAPAFGLPVPETLTTTKRNLHNADAAQFFEQHAPVMLKTLGLAGARNVTCVADVNAAEVFLAEYTGDMAVLLQERLALDEYVEMTVDLTVTDTDVVITNTRQILFADGLWVGNLLGGDVSLDEATRAQLLEVGAYARAHGHAHPLGLNCGIDFFVNRQPGAARPLLITEINARWTGGLFPAQFVRKLGWQQDRVVAFFDVVPLENLDAFLQFSERYRTAGAAFQALPIGFSPFPVDIDGRPHVYVWQMVRGDFVEFQRIKNERLGAAVLPTADLIRLPAADSTGD